MYSQLYKKKQGGAVMLSFEEFIKAFEAADEDKQKQIEQILNSVQPEESEQEETKEE